MPQDWILLWDCSVYHTLRIFGKLRGLHPSASAKRARELIDELEMHTFQNRIFQQYQAGKGSGFSLPWHGSPNPSFYCWMSRPRDWTPPLVAKFGGGYVRSGIKGAAYSSLLTTWKKRRRCAIELGYCIKEGSGQWTPWTGCVPYMRAISS